MEKDNNKGLKMQTLFAIIILVAGVVLMVFKIVADSEPGAIPLLLVLAGTGWYLGIRFQSRSRKHVK